MRVTDEEVKQIFATSLDTVPFIRTASAKIDDLGLASDHGAAMLREIELWLAAHLAAIRDPRIQSEGTGQAKVTYHGQSGLGLDHTPYGQQVKMLDSSGKLAKAGMRRVVIEAVDFSTAT